MERRKIYEMKILAITPNKKHDYLVAGTIEGLNKIPEVNLYCTDPGNNAKVVISEQLFLDKKADADFILVFTGKKPGKYHLLEQFTDNDWERTACIDGSEWSFPSYMPPFDKTKLVWWDMLERCKWYFKRECYPEYYELGVIPFPFPAIDSDFGGYDEEKDIDVLCAFGNIRGLPFHSYSISWRQFAIDACEELKKEGYNIINHKVGGDYFKWVNRSWITIDAFGGGEWNARTLQIPANKSYALYKRFGIITPKDFRPGSQQWDTSKDLKEKIRYLLTQKHLLQLWTEEEYTRTKYSLSSEPRARFLLKTITDGEFSRQDTGQA